LLRFEGRNQACQIFKINLICMGFSSQVHRDEHSMNIFELAFDAGREYEYICNSDTLHITTSRKKPFYPMNSYIYSLIFTMHLPVAHCYNIYNTGYLAVVHCYLPHHCGGSLQGSCPAFNELVTLTLAVLYNIIGQVEENQPMIYANCRVCNGL